MKAYTKTLICIFIAMLYLSTGEVRAIELVRNNGDDYAGPGSIIRHYADGIDIVCYNTKSTPYFMIYKQGSPTSYELFLHPMDTVSDFEIYNDTIYFCGEGHINRAGDAVVGYFAAPDLLNMNPSNVFYLTLPSMSKIRAIDVGWFASRKHVVGVGEDLGAKGAMVDMIDETAYWKVNFGDVGGDTILLSDVAITQSHVVATSTSKNSFLPAVYGSLWYFEIPTSAGASIFPCNVTYYDHAMGVRKKYIIKTMAGDMFVTALQMDSFIGVSTIFEVSYYTGTTCTERVEIDEGPRSFLGLSDISFTIGGWMVNLLASGFRNTATGSVPQSVIYELNYGALPATVPAHVYDGVIFESLDNIRSFNLDNQHFVSSGYEPSVSGIPYYLKYRSLYFGGGCLEEKEFTVEKIVPKDNYGSKAIGNTVTLQVPMLIVSERMEISVETKCSAPTRTPENEK